MNSSHLETTHLPVSNLNNQVLIYSVVHAKGAMLQITPEPQPTVHAYFENKPDMKMAVTIGHIHNIDFSHPTDTVCLTHKNLDLDCCKKAIDIAIEF
ncbi:MAG: hypothetical protein CMD81_16055 [Gammaproteobacteria bacterium]|jgi:hypothetical protein|nr:hypothetical protein [Gammaproteobacteria bacterium]HCV03232.1 hypothetical protein [Pseudoalteromonas sp.]MBK82345.1 hypothetical protein [Gammaproteobacteria bacterium]MBK82368.1 hypothetical protein [Gammaproteobacteria bacterium]MBK83559.1 hypothetical protein [Gammaproteobacteria bacterium]|tara:strand:+ start:1690 stop:1980 length:291 start_codon:yes stop_codon:yes gene_type:complete